MPLSEQEQRLLDEMERHLLRNDADVVSAPASGRTLSYRNMVYGALLVVVGIGALIAGVSLGDGLGLVIGVLGFGAIFAGVILALTPAKETPQMPSATAGARKATSSSSSFMDRMNDRWDKRQDGR